MRAGSAIRKPKRREGGMEFAIRTSLPPSPPCQPGLARRRGRGHLIDRTAANLHLAFLAERSKERVDLDGRHGPADQEALQIFALDEAQELQLILILDTLGDDREVHGVTERDQRLDEGIGGGVEADIA